jgi:hypothetical protein
MKKDSRRKYKDGWRRSSASYRDALEVESYCSFCVLEASLRQCRALSILSHHQRSGKASRDYKRLSASSREKVQIEKRQRIPDAAKEKLHLQGDEERSGKESGEGEHSEDSVLVFF